MQAHLVIVLLVAPWLVTWAWLSRLRTCFDGKAPRSPGAAHLCLCPHPRVALAVQLTHTCHPPCCRSLPYLTAVIVESLRFFSPVPFIGRVLEQDTNVGGYMLPRGLEIAVPPMAVHHNESVWPRSWEFRPERHLKPTADSDAGGARGRRRGSSGVGAGADDAGARKRGSTGTGSGHGAASSGSGSGSSLLSARARESYSLLPFSAGSRSCVGRNFALLEEKVVLAALLRRYDVRTPAEQDVVPSLDLIIKPRDGKLLLRFTRRDHGAGAGTRATSDTGTSKGAAAPP